MAEKSIIFSGEMANAILDGRKTMTRRVMKPQPIAIPGVAYRYDGVQEGIHALEFLNGGMPTEKYVPCGKPPYNPGDVLWVRETWRLVDFEHIDGDWNASVEYKDMSRGPRLHNLTDNERFGWRSPLHMPRSAARIFLRVTDVWADPLQAITRKEGIIEGFPEGEGFVEYWDALNKKRGYGWNTNPWVWVYTFERITTE